MTQGLPIQPKWADTIFYWMGGAQVGEWRRTLGATPEMFADLERTGRFAVWGKLSIGAPEGSPYRREVR